MLRIQLANLPYSGAREEFDGEQPELVHVPGAVNDLGHRLVEEDQPNLIGLKGALLALGFSSQAKVGDASRQRRREANVLPVADSLLKERAQRYAI